MQYQCAYCHEVFSAEAEDEHKVCPNCKAEAGLEQVKEGTPAAMRNFGLVLLVAALVAVGGLLAGLAS